MLATPVTASPWVIDRGDVLVISRLNYFSADLDIAATPGGRANGRFEQAETETYAEWSPFSDFMIGAHVNYGLSTLSADMFSVQSNGFSRVEGFAQYQLFRNPTHAGAVRLAAGRPGRFRSGARPGLAADGLDTVASILYGRDIRSYPFKIFSSVDIGYRRRFGDSADVVEGAALLGVEPNRRWMSLTEVTAGYSLRNEDVGGADYDIVRVTQSISWRFNSKSAVQLGAAQDIGGRNISRGRSLFVGLWTRF